MAIFTIKVVWLDGRIVCELSNGRIKTGVRSVPDLDAVVAAMMGVRAGLSR